MDGAKTFRSSLNALMAIAATGSIAYFALDNLRPDLVQKISRTPVPSSAHATATDKNQSWKLGAVIEKFVESDRAYLSERGLWSASGGLVLSFRTNDDDPAHASNRPGQTRRIRERFAHAVTGQPTAGQPGHSLFLPMNEATAQPKVHEHKEPRQAAPATVQPPPADRQSGPPHVKQAPAKNTAQAARPAAAKTGFQEVVPQTPSSRQNIAQQPTRPAAADRPAPQPQTQLQQTPSRAASTDVREDDAETVAILMDQARRDIRMAPYAFAAARAYRARYPRDSWTPVFASRIGDLQASLFDAIRERQEISHTTILTEVQFGEEARAELVACLKASGKLERAVIAAREIRHQPATPAFMVALRAKQTGKDEQLTPDEVTNAAGPCLTPLFLRGTVTLFHASQEESEIAIKRLEALAGAVVYDREMARNTPAPASAASGGGKG